MKKHPDLSYIKTKQDRGTKILSYLAEVLVNGNPDVNKPDPSRTFQVPKVPVYNPEKIPMAGTKQLLDHLGPDKFTTWLKEQKKVQFTDCTMRDAHQSLLATRVRTTDMLRVAGSFAQHHPQLFSMEVSGGATFDVALRFLHEDPWKRLQLLSRPFQIPATNADQGLECCWLYLLP